jgi:anthranilate phosphoribosyltransferase
MERLFAGDSDKVVRCAVLLNAAAALYVSANGWSLEEAVAQGEESLASGAAARVLERLRKAAPSSF